ncbi:hypothetical protein IWX58_004897 [Rubrivivax gelatinosus]|nr:hypothetical protein [Rubrivivax gelatinosus]
MRAPGARPPEHGGDARACVGARRRRCVEGSAFTVLHAYLVHEAYVAPLAECRGAARRGGYDLEWGIP